MGSSYMDLGQIHRQGLNYTFSEFGAPEKFQYHSSLRKLGTRPPLQEEADEHMQEFPGSQKNPVAVQKKFYQNALKEVEHPIEKPLTKTVDELLEWGHPMKHHVHSNKKCVPPKDLEKGLERSNLKIRPGPLPDDLEERKPAWKPGEWGMMDKHRYHQPPMWAPKDDLGVSRIPHGPGDPKAMEVPVGGYPVNVVAQASQTKRSWHLVGLHLAAVKEYIQHTHTCLVNQIQIF